MTSASDTILVAAGGTGGHVFPGLAVADALRLLADVNVVFAGTARGLEKDLVPARGYPLELLQVSPMMGGGPRRAVTGAASAALATVRALALVRRLKPRAILSVGGYAAGPVSLAAAAMGVPLAVLEPNATLGFTQKVLSPIARRVYTAFPIGGPRAKRLGVPLRAGFAPRPYTPNYPPRVLVMGGSQGAAALNERVPQALAQIDRQMEIVHQVGQGREEAVRRAYGSRTATVIGFLDDVPQAIERADVIVARAGANTVAEIAAIGRASILIPFPFAAGDHQFMNADALARAGGAMCIRQEAADVPRLARELDFLLGDSVARVRMADAARAHGRPAASDDIARDLLDLAGIAPRRPSQKTNGVHHTEVR